MRPQWMAGRGRQRWSMDEECCRLLEGAVVWSTAALQEDRQWEEVYRVAPDSVCMGD